MERYTKPECEIIRMDTANSLLEASPNTIHEEVGNGKWHAPQRRDAYWDEDEDFE